MLIGYARVSTDDQDTAAQVAALQAAGCECIFRDKASGGRWDRPQFLRLLNQLRAGDVVVVWKLDRLSRSRAIRPCRAPNVSDNVFILQLRVRLNRLPFSILLQRWWFGETASGRCRVRRSLLEVLQQFADEFSLLSKSRLVMVYGAERGLSDERGHPRLVKAKDRKSLDNDRSQQLSGLVDVRVPNRLPLID